MNLQQIQVKVVEEFLIFVVILLVLVLFTKASAFVTTDLTVYDLHSTDSDLLNASYDKKKALLKENDWVSEKVDEETFDYIFVMAQQLAKVHNIDPNLALAVIAVESNFNPDCTYAGAVGLMQLLPKWHEDRMRGYLEDGVEPELEWFYEPRYNLSCGLEYLSYILHEEVAENEEYALMWYNQGATSAAKTYSRGFVSDYAKAVLELRDELSLYDICKEG